MKPEQERVKSVLTDTVTLLCKNGLSYERELRVQAVIGVTVDENEVFLVHINESFGANGASSTSSLATATAAETSMAVVPYSPHGQQPKHEFEARTPSSGVKRMRAESISGMSPSSNVARQHAKQQLMFASPTKHAAASLPGLPAQTMGHVNTAPRAGRMLTRGGVRGGRRGAVGRGFPASRSQRGGLGTTRASSRHRVPRGSVHIRGQRLPSFSTGYQLPADKSANLLSSYDMKFTPCNMSTAAEPSSSHMTQSSTAADSSVGFNFNAYHPPATFAFTGAPASGASGYHNPGASCTDDLPSFSTSEHNRYANTVPPGFGFDGVFPSDSSTGVHTGSFADISPSLEFGFQPSFTSSSAGGSFARSVNSVSTSDIKTESLDDDVIFVDDDASAATDSASALGGQALFEGSSDVGNGDDGVGGAAVQQITRRVTITTNIQGQNVKYEQVYHSHLSLCL